MNVILYMEVSVNGYIAGEDGNVDWVSKEAWDSYVSVTSKVDAVIIGRRTYDIMPPDEFHKNVLYVIVTHRPLEKKKTQRVTTTDEPPQEVLKMLEEKGVTSVCVSGGKTIDTLFMQAELIDEVYLDVEPILLGSGIQLFDPNDFTCNMKLLAVKKLNGNTVQLHYQVVK